MGCQAEGRGPRAQLGAGPPLPSPGSVAFWGQSSGPTRPLSGRPEESQGAEWAHLVGPGCVFTASPRAWEGGLVILLNQMRKSVERVQGCCPASQNGSWQSWDATQGGLGLFQRTATKGPPHLLPVFGAAGPHRPGLEVTACCRKPPGAPALEQGREML